MSHFRISRLTLWLFFLCNAHTLFHLCVQILCHISSLSQDLPLLVDVPTHLVLHDKKVDLGVQTTRVTCLLTSKHNFPDSKPNLKYLKQGPDSIIDIFLFQLFFLFVKRHGDNFVFEFIMCRLSEVLHDGSILSLLIYNSVKSIEHLFLQFLQSSLRHSLIQKDHMLLVFHLKYISR